MVMIDDGRGCDEEESRLSGLSGKAKGASRQVMRAAQKSWGRGTQCASSNSRDASRRSERKEIFQGGGRL